MLTETSSVDKGDCCLVCNSFLFFYKYVGRVTYRQEFMVRSFEAQTSAKSRISQKGASTPEFWSRTYYLRRFLPETAWRLKKLDRGRGVPGVPPLGSANGEVCKRFLSFFFFIYLSGRKGSFKRDRKKRRFSHTRGDMEQRRSLQIGLSKYHFHFSWSPSDIKNKKTPIVIQFISRWLYFVNALK